MVGKMKQGGIIRVSVYFNKEELATLATEAEKAKFRRVGIATMRQKEHGFNNEWEAGTKGLGLFLKSCYSYYMRHEAERLSEASKIAQEKQALQAREEKLAAQGLASFLSGKKE